MGQTKFEKKIKEQLDSREIQPSAQAWDRLDAMLTVAEEKKPKRSFGWLYIAAGILVFLSIGLFFLSKNDDAVNTQNDVVVNEEPKMDSKSDESEVNGNNASDSFILPDAEFRKATEKSAAQKPNTSIAESNKGFNSINQKTINQKTNNQNQQNPLHESGARSGGAINRQKEIEFQNSSDVAQKDLPKIMEQKAITIDNRPKVKTDEQLLAGLDNVAKQTTNQKSTLKVDAKSLLSQVDGELEMTFREKVINKVSKNYKEIKVALANRNKE